MIIIIIQSWGAWPAGRGRGPGVVCMYDIACFDVYNMILHVHCM